MNFLVCLIKRLHCEASTLLKISSTSLPKMCVCVCLIHKQKFPLFSSFRFLQSRCVAKQQEFYFNFLLKNDVECHSVDLQIMTNFTRSDSGSGGRLSYGDGGWGTDLHSINSMHALFASCH